MKSFSLLAVAGLASAMAMPQGATPLTIKSVRPLQERDGSQKACVGNITSTSISPSLIVNVNKRLPNTKFGASPQPIVSPNGFCSIFNLEIPAGSTAKICDLEFVLPDISQTEIPYIAKGEGHYTFTGYAIGAGATEQTTYNNQPAAGPSPPTPPPVIKPGNAYTINAGPCFTPADQKVTVSGMLCSTDSWLTFTQSKSTESGACPIGFFVNVQG